jgi:cobalt/nickel transport system permease protein
MHIPDVFIPLWQSAVYWVIALVFISLSVKWAQNQMNEDRIPIIAVLAAGIFAIQSFNLPVAIGTSGRLAGGALAAIILGSAFGAAFILTLVLIIQAILFGDGGITVMGANILIMGVIGGFSGYNSCQVLLTVIKKAYLSSAVAGTFPLMPGLVAMGLYHAVIGIIEGIITAVILYPFATSRPDLVSSSFGVISQ